MEYPKNLPFANYDINVYFGVGILSLPLFNWVFKGTFSQYIPKIEVNFGSQFVTTTVTLLAVLFSGYAIGHILAFASSYFIEKFLHRHYGYPSDLYLEQIDQNITGIDFNISWTKMYSSPAMLAMSIFHLPVIPFYIVLHAIGAKGYYLPKLPFELKDIVSQKLIELDLKVEVKKETRWAKLVEHFVANNCPSGYARMYNYLVIFGILRSISFLSICMTWAYVISAFFDRSYDRLGHITNISVHGLYHPAAFALGYVILSGFSALCFMNFAKFNRRYFEEGIQAFALANFVPKSS